MNWTLILGRTRGTSKKERVSTPCLKQLKRGWEKKQFSAKVWVWRTRIFWDHTQKSPQNKPISSVWSAAETRLKRSWSVIWTSKEHVIFARGCQYQMAMRSSQHLPPGNLISKTLNFGWNRVLTLCRRRRNWRNRRFLGDVFMRDKSAWIHGENRCKNTVMHSLPCQSVVAK